MRGCARPAGCLHLAYLLARTQFVCLDVADGTAAIHVLQRGTGELQAAKEE